MDPISKHLADWKLPVGQWGKAFIDFIIEHFQWFFDAISASLTWFFEGSSHLLLQVPPLLLAAILAGIAYWLQRSKWLALRSEEHTSELQSLRHLVCRLLLEKKKHTTN